MSSQAVFGQRGFAAPEAPKRSATSRKPERVSDIEDVPADAKNGLFSFLEDDEDFLDVRLGSEYAKDKSMWIAVPLWLFLGSTGAHRFYLGHRRMGSAFIVFGLIMGFMLLSSLANEAGRIFHGGSLDFKSLGAASIVWYAGFTIWVFVDGVYVICRMASSR